MTRGQAAQAPAQAPAHAVDERTLHRKMMRRILPFLFVCYVISYLDRVDVGFALGTFVVALGAAATSAILIGRAHARAALPV